MPRPGELHLHKCGWSPTVSTNLHGKGCGYVFAHVRVTDVSDAVYDRGHLCPQCKAGPWKNVWEQHVEDHWNSLSPAEQADVRDDVARQDALAELFERLFGGKL